MIKSEKQLALANKRRPVPKTPAAVRAASKAIEKRLATVPPGATSTTTPAGIRAHDPDVVKPKPARAAKKAHKRTPKRKAK